MRKERRLAGEQRSATWIQKVQGYRRTGARKRRAQALSAFHAATASLTSPSSASQMLSVSSQPTSCLARSATARLLVPVRAPFAVRPLYSLQARGREGESGRQSKGADQRERAEDGAPAIDAPRAALLELAEPLEDVADLDADVLPGEEVGRRAEDVVRVRVGRRRRRVGREELLRERQVERAQRADGDARPDVGCRSRGDGRCQQPCGARLWQRALALTSRLDVCRPLVLEREPDRVRDLTSRGTRREGQPEYPVRRMSGTTTHLLRDGVDRAGTATEDRGREDDVAEELAPLERLGHSASAERATRGG